MDFNFQDADVDGLQFRIADLRESARVGLEEIHPADPIATDAQLAELRFYLGWAKLLAGELFVALPIAAGGVPVSSTENVEAAIADFIEAEALSPDNASYKLALARAYHYLGNKASAVAKAEEAIALDAAFTRTVVFDGVNGPDNDLADALFERGNFDDLQPLPRLDFLDPKYRVVGDDESPVYIQKIEEAHLILIEADLSDNNLADAQAEMTGLLTLVSTRQVDNFNDAVEGRNNRARPDTSTVSIRFSEGDTLVDGLVLSRAFGENVSIPVVSGTSVTQTMVDGITDQLQALEILYLMRQEIFIAEGRRFTDLGFKMPVSQVEQLNNPNVTDVHIQPFVPAFIPEDIDAFTYDPATFECTITHNLNRIIVENRTDAAVIPFF